MKLRGNHGRALAAINGCMRHAGSWLELSAPTSESVTPSSTWVLLTRNASLDGAARLAVSAGASAAHLRADVFIDDHVDLDKRIAAACEDMCAASRGVNAETHPSAGPHTRRLVELCGEAEWPCAEREAGDVSVPIDVGFDVYQARLELTPDGRLRAMVDLADAAARGSTARAAMALLLLTASDVVRAVKGVAITRDGVDRFGLAVAGERHCSSAAIDRSLSALTVACRAVGREMHALGREAFASDYLAWRTPAPPDEPEDVVHEQPAMEDNTCLQQP